MPGEQGQHGREILEAREDLLDGHERDVDPGQRGREAAIALVGDQHDRAGVGAHEVRAAHAEVGGQELAAQLLLREGAELLPLVRQLAAGEVREEAR